MTVMVDWEIRRAVGSGDIKLDPYLEQNIQPNSYDVRLGNEFISFPLSDRVIDPKDAGSLEGYEKKVVPMDKGLILQPHEFILGTTLESVYLSNTTCAEITGRSSYGRLGIELHQTAGWIDSGFEGQITLELMNNNACPVVLYVGSRIGQLVFHKTEPCLIPYDRRNGAKYRSQKGTTVSKVNVDFV